MPCSALGAPLPHPSPGILPAVSSSMDWSGGISQVRGGRWSLRWENSCSSSPSPVSLVSQEGRDPPIPPLKGPGEPKELGSEYNRA